MKLVEMRLEDLAPSPYNPRKGLKPGDREYESLKRSIEEFGVVDPVIFNTRTKRLVGGHQRLSVLRGLGHASAPTVLVDLDELREKALNLALNKITGEWDMPLLKDLLLDIERSGGDQTLTGFDPREIEGIIERYRDDDSGEGLPVPEPPAEPVSRAGDLYEARAASPGLRRLAPGGDLGAAYGTRARALHVDRSPVRRRPARRWAQRRLRRAPP